MIFYNINLWYNRKIKNSNQLETLSKTVYCDCDCQIQICKRWFGQKIFALLPSESKFTLLLQLGDTLILRLSRWNISKALCSMFVNASPHIGSNPIFFAFDLIWFRQLWRIYTQTSTFLDGPTLFRLMTTLRHFCMCLFAKCCRGSKSGLSSKKSKNTVCCNFDVRSWRFSSFAHKIKSNSVSFSL